LQPRPTAIFAGNNLMTLGVFLALREHGLAAPGDVAVVGFDDMAWLSAFTPGVTTVAQPVYEIGKCAAELLLDRLTAQPPEHPRTKVLPTQLVIRESSGGPVPVAATT
jgi:LacI family fructose operon transcriptional repressor